MSKKPEDQIEERLRQLELSMKEENGAGLPAKSEKSSELSKSSGQTSSSITSSKKSTSKEDDDLAVKGDLHLFGGFAALAVGLLILFSNIRVTSGWGFGAFSFFGGSGGQGFLLMLLIVGIGFFFYDYKNKIGWVLTGGSLLALIYGFFASLHVGIMSMNLLGFLFMFIPLAFGGALVARGIKIHSRIENKDDK